MDVGMFKLLVIRCSDAYAQWYTIVQDCFDQFKVILLLCTKAATAFSMSYLVQFCPSVCLPHGWISQKWCKLGSPNLHRRLPGRL